MNIDNIPILKYLKINRSHYGEVFIDDIFIPKTFLNREINKERQELIQSSLIEFEGNVFPIIIRNIDKSKYDESETENKLYELIFGAEICQIAFEFIKKIGQEKAQELRINKIRAYLIEIEDNDIKDFREKMANILNYKPITDENIEAENKTNMSMNSQYEKLCELYDQESKHQELIDFLKSEKIDKTILYQFILLHYKIDNFTKLRGIKITNKITRDKLINIIIASL